MAHVNDGMRHVDERVCERLAKRPSIRFRDEQEPFVGPEPQGGNPGPLCRGARFLRQGQAEHLASLLARNFPSPEYETTGRAVLAQREGAAPSGKAIPSTALSNFRSAIEPRSVRIEEHGINDACRNWTRGHLDVDRLSSARESAGEEC